MKKITIEVGINQMTLDAHGEYVDYVFVPELSDSVRVIVKRDTKNPPHMSKESLRLQAFDDKN